MSLDGDRVMLIFIIRTDVKMSKGQIAGKVADVTQYIVEDCLQRRYIAYTTWRKFHGSQKIVLRVNSLREFCEVHSKLLDLSSELSFPIKIVKDDPKIKSTDSIPIVLGFGPIKRNKVEHIVANLKLL